MPIMWPVKHIVESIISRAQKMSLCAKKKNNGRAKFRLLFLFIGKRMSNQVRKRKRTKQTASQLPKRTQKFRKEDKQSRTENLLSLTEVGGFCEPAVLEKLLMETEAWIQSILYPDIWKIVIDYWMPVLVGSKEVQKVVFWREFFKETYQIRRYADSYCTSFLGYLVGPTHIFLFQLSKEGEFRKFQLNIIYNNNSSSSNCIYWNNLASWQYTKKYYYADFLVDFDEKLCSILTVFCIENKILCLIPQRVVLGKENKIDSSYFLVSSYFTIQNGLENENNHHNNFWLALQKCVVKGSEY